MAITWRTAQTWVNTSVVNSTTHDNSFSITAGDNYIRVTLSGFALNAITGVIWDPAGANIALSALGAVIQNADGRNLVEYAVASNSLGSGSKTLRVTFSTNQSELEFVFQSAAGVDVATPTSGYATFVTTGAGDAVSPTNLANISSATGDDVVSGVVFANAQTISAADGQTEDSNFNDGTLGVGRLATSHKAGGASVATNWTFTPTQDYCILGYSVKAAVVATNPRPKRMHVIQAIDSWWRQWAA